MIVSASVCIYVCICSILKLNCACCFIPSPSTVDLVKNTILGMTVFGTYELLAFDPSSILLANKDSLDGGATQSTSTTTTGSDLTIIANADGNNNDKLCIAGASSLRTIAAGSTSVVVHTGAGACAGVAHAAVLSLWDMIFKKQRHLWQVRRLHIIQHAVGYASLFGTYEGMRRGLEFGFYDLLVAQEARVMEFLQLHPLDWMKGEGGVYDITPLRWAFCLTAGGIAGQVHQLVTHAMANSRTLDWRKMLAVPIRSTLPTFWITGLSFVAFEFGGELTERYIKLEKLQEQKKGQLEQRRIEIKSKMEQPKVE